MGAYLAAKGENKMAKVGRPKVRKAKRLVPVSVNMTTQEREAMASIAKALRSTKSNVGRDAVVRLLANHGIIIEDKDGERITTVVEERMP